MALLSLQSKRSRIVFHTTSFPSSFRVRVNTENIQALLKFMSKVMQVPTKTKNKHTYTNKKTTIHTHTHTKDQRTTSLWKQSTTTESTYSSFQKLTVF